MPLASTSAAQQGFQNFFKKRRATPTPMGTRAPVRGACVSAMAIGARGAEGTRKKLRAAALAFPTAAAPLISPRLCGPPTGLTNSSQLLAVRCVSARPASYRGARALVLHPRARSLGHRVRP